MSEKLIGQITHYYHKIRVAVLTLTDSIQVGDHVHVLGHTTNFEQEITSIQIDHLPVDEAEPGQEVALKVTGRVRGGDRVYRILAEE
jgi:putative protease